MERAEKRTQKRKEVVEAVVVRKELITLVVRVFNISKRTVFDWLARYRQGGWSALAEKGWQGRPKKVTADDLKWLYEAITMGNPFNYQLPFCLWTTNTIRALLETERVLRLSKSGVCRLLGHLGLALNARCANPTNKTPRRSEPIWLKPILRPWQKRKGMEHVFISSMKRVFAAMPTEARPGQDW